jgi:hypothetical protein
MASSCRLRVAILTLSSSDDPLYIKQAVFVNGMYAAKHNYAFVVERCPGKQNTNKKWVKAGWEKPFYIKRYLRDFDVVLFIDRSLMFVDHSQKIEDAMGRFLDAGTSVVVHTTGAHDHADTQLMLFKNSPKAFEILDEWEQAPLTNMCKAWRNAPPFEKACFEKLREEKFVMQMRLVSSSKWVMDITDKPSQVTHRLEMLVSSSDLPLPLVTTPPPTHDAFTQDTNIPWSAVAVATTCLTVLLAWHVVSKKN